MITDWDTLAATVLGPSLSADVTVGGLTFSTDRFGWYTVRDESDHVIRAGRLSSFDLGEHKSLSLIARLYDYDGQRDEYTRAMCEWLVFVRANTDVDHVRAADMWFERLSETVVRGGVRGIGGMLFDEQQ